MRIKNRIYQNQVKSVKIIIKHIAKYKDSTVQYNFFNPATDTLQILIVQQVRTKVLPSIMFTMCTDTTNFSCILWTLLSPSPCYNGKVPQAIRNT